MYLHVTSELRIIKEIIVFFCYQQTWHIILLAISTGSFLSFFQYFLYLDEHLEWVNVVDEIDSIEAAAAASASADCSCVTSVSFVADDVSKEIGAGVRIKLGKGHLKREEVSFKIAIFSISDIRVSTVFSSRLVLPVY
jgi:hypothetical protein